MARSLKELDVKADALYDAEVGWQGFVAEFSVEELNALEALCQMNPENDYLCASYDDEVYDALYFLNQN